MIIDKGVNVLFDMWNAKTQNAQTIIRFGYRIFSSLKRFRHTVCIPNKTAVQYKTFKVQSTRTDALLSLLDPRMAANEWEAAPEGKMVFFP